MKLEDIQEMLFEQTLGMNKEKFMRTAGLLRNPEGFEKPGYCPVCKKELVQNEKGDLFCKNYDIGYKESGKCYWHRYEDGLNYWSSPEDMFNSMCKTDPEFKQKYDEIKNQI